MHVSADLIVQVDALLRKQLSRFLAQMLVAYSRGMLGNIPVQRSAFLVSRHETSPSKCLVGFLKESLGTSCDDGALSTAPAEGQEPNSTAYLQFSVLSSDPQIGDGGGDERPPLPPPPFETAEVDPPSQSSQVTFCLSNNNALFIYNIYICHFSAAATQYHICGLPWCTNYWLLRGPSVSCMSLSLSPFLHKYLVESLHIYVHSPFVLIRTFLYCLCLYVGV